VNCGRHLGLSKGQQTKKLTEMTANKGILYKYESHEKVIIVENFERKFNLSGNLKQ